MSNPFVKAVKEQVKLRMAFVGASGSGKTWTALELATRLVELEGGRIALVDTEGRSARLYASNFDFDVLDLSNNFDPKEYIKAIEAAAANGYTVLIIDSLTHAWNGSGGVLAIVDKAASKVRDNTFAGWSEGRPAQNALVSAILNADIHILGTMRAKTDYVMQTDPVTGKTKPVKIGLAPVQDANFDYEFTMSVMLDRDHTMTVDKSRCSPVKVGDELTDIDWLGNTLHAWLTDGEMPAWNTRPNAKAWISAKLALFPNVSKQDGFKQIDSNATGWSSLSISETELLRHLADLNQPKSEQSEPEQPAPDAPAEPAPKAKGFPAVATKTVYPNPEPKFNITTTPEMIERAKQGKPVDDVPLFSDDELADMEKERA